jgi:hypothetical protein
MKRRELEHVLRAAANAVEQRDFLVIGTASILGTYDERVLPERATRSREADLAPFNENAQGDKSMLVEGVLGSGQPSYSAAVWRQTGSAGSSYRARIDRVGGLDSISGFANRIL